MDDADVNAILAIIPQGSIELRDAIRNASPSPATPFAPGTPVGRITAGKIVIFQFPAKLVTTELFELFRETPWLLSAGPDIRPVPGEYTVTIWAKDSISASSSEEGLCYHVTERSNVPSIQRNGLQPGVRHGKQPRDLRFPDSIHHIHASVSLPDAWAWSRTLPTPEDFVLYRVRAREAGLNLLVDPCSGGQGGCIIDAACVESRYLDGPFELPNDELPPRKPRLFR